jgi:hypothetical protein
MMPSRRDIDALCLGPILPHIWLCDYEAERNTFRYRLAGEEVNAAFGCRLAGCLLSDVVLSERFETVNRIFLRVMQEKLALHAEGPIYRCTDRVNLGERLVLPLSSDGETADGLVGVTVRSESIDPTYGQSHEGQMYAFVPVRELTETAPAASVKHVAGGR